MLRRRHPAPPSRDRPAPRAGRPAGQDARAGRDRVAGGRARPPRRCPRLRRVQRAARGVRGRDRRARRGTPRARARRVRLGGGPRGRGRRDVLPATAPRSRDRWVLRGDAEAPEIVFPARMLIDVILPQLGESVAEGTISKWLVREGDVVAKDQPLVSIATDKADSDLPAPAAGRVVKLLAAEGQVVAVKAVLAQIDDAAQG